MAVRGVGSGSLQTRRWRLSLNAGEVENRDEEDGEVENGEVENGVMVSKWSRQICSPRL
nr:hypothetical protein Itr_chr11CG13790 [Ipomoea trifida]